MSSKPSRVRRSSRTRTRRPVRAPSRSGRRQSRRAPRSFASARQKNSFVRPPHSTQQYTGRLLSRRSLVDRTQTQPLLTATRACGCENSGIPRILPAVMVIPKQPDAVEASLFQRSLGVFRYSERAIGLVWTTSRPLTVALALLTVVAGVLPAAIAYVGQLIVDGVVAAMSRTMPDTRACSGSIVLEAAVVIALAGQPARAVGQSVAAARAARAARQRHDPRKSADAATRALRGFRVLRQADAGAARSVEPTAEPRQPHVRPRAERHLAVAATPCCCSRSRRGRW